MSINKKDIQEFDNLSTGKPGISIVRNWQTTQDQQHDVFQAHRDKQYILILGTSGNIKLMLDFEEVTVNAPFVMIILPGQVHQLIEASDFELFNIDFIPSLIPLELQNLLYKNFFGNNTISINSALHEQLLVISQLLYKIQQDASNTYHNQSIHQLLLTMLYLIAGSGFPLQQHHTKETRTALIEQQFNHLLKDNYVKWKKPSQYATSLAISVSHLNDSIREITGNSVSYHIQQHLALEAKRLLFFSKKNVKEIGYDLGFDDPIYFNKLFKKITGITPLAFRSKFRDSDH